MIEIYIYIYIYIYIEREREMVDLCESDKMIKISGKVYKSNTYNWFRSNILCFIHHYFIYFLNC